LTRRLGSPVGRNIGWLIAERFFSLIITGAVSVVVVRYLGPARFGAYSFAAAIVGIVGSVAQLTGALVVRDIVIDREREGETLGSAALITLLLVLASEAVLLILGLTVVHDSTTRAVLLVLALGLLFRPVLVLDFVFQADLRARHATYARNAGVAVAAVATIMVVARSGGLVQLAAATLLSPLVTALLFVRFYARGGPVPRWRPSRAILSSLARRSFPLIISTVAIGVYLKIDQVILGWRSTEEEVGIYAATARISEFAYFLPMIFIASVGPSIARARATDVELYKAHMFRIFCYLTAASLTIAAATVVVGGRLATFLYGTEYARVGKILVVHIFASLFVFLGVGESLWTVNEALEKLAMYRTVAGAIVNVVLCFVLIPRYGALGAAWATLVAYAVASTVGNLFHRDTRPVFWMQVRALSPLSWLAALRFDLQRPTS
jgi:PST family polysaccharide transporter